MKKNRIDKLPRSFLVHYVIDCSYTIEISATSLDEAIEEANQQGVPLRKLEVNEVEVSEWTHEDDHNGDMNLRIAGVR